MHPRTLANALTTLLPGDLTAALEQATEEERWAIERILRRAQMIRELRAMERPIAQLLRQRAARGVMR